MSFTFSTTTRPDMHPTQKIDTNPKDTIKTTWSELREYIAKETKQQTKELARHETMRNMKSILKRWGYIPAEEKRWLVANLMTTDEDIYIRIWRGVASIEVQARVKEKEEKRMLREDGRSWKLML